MNAPLGDGPAGGPTGGGPARPAVRRTMSERTLAAGRESLSGRRRGLRAFLPFVGPAVMASVAYVDPGNFATNIQAGSQFGYLLLWVVVAANLIAMLYQGLSAKLGIVTGRSLAELCREELPRGLVIAMWLASEIAAMATDLAEFLGASIGLSLLFGLPLMACLCATAVATYAMLTMQGRGFRPIEYLIGGFVTAIGLCYLIEMLVAHIDWTSFALGSVTPAFAGPESVTIAVGIVGATVMPHAIYLHSALTRDRVPTHTDADRRTILRYSKREVVIALGIAGLINMAMVAVAAAAFHQGHSDIAEIETAYRTLIPLLGGGAAGVFMVSLLASGFSSSVVGTIAAQGIMQDFVHFRIPLWLRRVVTMAPAFVVVAMGVGATEALVLSQVVLSLVLPIPMIALLWLTARRDIMGSFVSGPLTRLASIVATVLVLSMNTVLLLQQAGVTIPGLG
jgi:manganese transport protein